MKQLIIITFFTIFFSTACNNESGGVMIRVENTNDFDYENVYVATGNWDNNFGNIQAQSNSKYQLFENAYRYGYVQLEINGETYVVQPIDYVGESLLEEGKYTYILDADTVSGHMSLDFRKD